MNTTASSLIIQRVVDRLYRDVKRHLGIAQNVKQRAIVQVEEWSGAASNYSSTDAYCAACLIDVNEAAGLDEKIQSHCKLPIRREEDGSDVFVWQAVTAAAGGNGIQAVEKPDDVPQEAWDAAVKEAAIKIVEAYDENDTEAPESVLALAGMERMIKDRALEVWQLTDKIWDAANDKYPSAWLVSVFVENGTDWFAILEQDSKLYKSAILISDTNEVTLDDWVLVEQEFVEMPRTRTSIIREEDGTVRWLSISATSTLNKQTEIDSTSLFDSFTDFISRTGQFPYRTIYHQGERMRTGQADGAWRIGFCYITTGVYDNSFLARAEIETIEKFPDQWGESIYYVPTSKPDLTLIDGKVVVPVYRSGINIEISTVLQKDACNHFTGTTVKRSQIMTIDQRTLEGIAQLVFQGDLEKARNWLEENPEEVNRFIKSNGLIARTDTDDSDDAAAGQNEEMVHPEVPTLVSNDGGKTWFTKPEPVADTAGTDVILDDALVDTIVERMTAHPSIAEQISTAIQPIAAQVEQLMTEVRRITKPASGILPIDRPSNGAVKVGFLPSKARATEDDEEENAPKSPAQQAEAVLANIAPAKW